MVVVSSSLDSLDLLITKDSLDGLLIGAIDIFREAVNDQLALILVCMHIEAILLYLIGHLGIGTGVVVTRDVDLLWTINKILGGFAIEQV